jgi:hypothetical protein
MSGIGALHRASRAGLLGRKAALARLLRETEAGILLKRTPRTALPSSCLPARCRGYRFEEGDGTYRSGPCRVWIKVRNPASIAVQRERSENWHR